MYDPITNCTQRLLFWRFSHQPQAGRLTFPVYTRLAHILNWEKLAKEAKFHPATMAALCPISLRQLERFFIERFKQTPLEWARQLRCRLACQLITQGWSNKAVVAELGFANESHLCHEFRRFYAAPPQTFAPLYEAVRHIPNGRTSLLHVPAPGEAHGTLVAV